VCAGDINGDERVDLLVSETQGETDRGRVFVYFGAIPFDDKPDLVFVGERNYNHFGIRVEVLDFNADGFDDAAVSAYFHDETRGRVYVYFGGTQPDDTADLVFSGENRGDAFGNSLATGDLNHDGVDDLAIASYWNDSRGIDAGRVTVHFGAKAPDRAVDLIFDGAASGENFGNTITAGDYDGDRIDDLVVGAYHSGASGYHAGAVYGFRGGVSMSSAPDLVLLGEAPVDQLGTVVSACDIDRDGAAEIIVAAAGQDYTGDDAGRVYIFAGGKDRDHVAEIVLSGKTKGDGFGICLVPVADIGDGIPGLLIGAHNYGGSSSYSGQAYLYTFASR
jgi:hypothetical protein